MHRRSLVQRGLHGIGLMILLPWLLIQQAQANIDIIKKVVKGDDQWQADLTPAQYDVLRHEGTEAPYSSSLNDEHRVGTFVCAGCELPLFSSECKFDSGTGWPSFYDHIADHIETKRDYKMILPRTEYHCARCGGHQGHIFDDGPQPTGLRHCNNGVALKFKPRIAQK